MGKEEVTSTELRAVMMVIVNIKTTVAQAHSMLCTALSI